MTLLPPCFAGPWHGKDKALGGQNDQARCIHQVYADIEMF